MSNFKDLAKSLPDRTQSFEIDITGETTRLKYKGEFSFTIPNLKASASIAKNEAVLNGGLDSILDFGVKNLHHMISYLKFTITKSPKFWEESNSGYELDDANVVEAIYNEALKLEAAWVKACWGDDSEEEETVK